MQIEEYLQIRTLSLVFIGDFNPIIVQPAWLAAKKLIREQESENAKIEIIHNDLVRFDLEWVTVEISQKRFEIRTASEPHFEPARDLMAGIFEILKETPIKSLGINHLLHYALPDEASYIKFGDKLAPLSNWDDFMNSPRVLLLDIVEQKSKNKEKGGMRVRISGSDQALKTKFALLININDSYELAIGETGRSNEMVDRLRKNWTSSFKRASEIPEKIWSKINL